MHTTRDIFQKEIVLVSTMSRKGERLVLRRQSAVASIGSAQILRKRDATSFDSRGTTGQKSFPWKSSPRKTSTSSTNKRFPHTLLEGQAPVIKKRTRRHMFPLVCGSSSLHFHIVMLTTRFTTPKALKRFSKRL